jgi:hypothetical protein
MASRGSGGAAGAAAQPQEAQPPTREEVLAQQAVDAALNAEANAKARSSGSEKAARAAQQHATGSAAEVIRLRNALAALASSMHNGGLTARGDGGAGGAGGVPPQSAQYVKAEQDVEDAVRAEAAAAAELLQLQQQAAIDAEHLMMACADVDRAYAILAGVTLKAAAAAAAALFFRTYPSMHSAHERQNPLPYPYANAQLPVKNDVQAALRGRAAFLTGAGLSMALTRSLTAGASRDETAASAAKSWRELMEEFLQESGAMVGADLTDIIGRLRDREVNACDDLLTKAFALLGNIWPGANAEAYPDYRRVIYRMFSGLRPTSPALAGVLHRRGLPLLTVNYDTLLEEATRRVPISHIDMMAEGKLKMWLENKNMFPGAQGHAGTLYNIHLHGTWYERDHVHGFAFSQAEYVASAAMQQFLLFMVQFITGNSVVLGSAPEKLAKTCQLVIVGASGTLEDAHFIALWTVLGRLQCGGSLVDWSASPHYVLCTEASLVSMRDMCQRIWDAHGVLLVPVQYSNMRTSSVGANDDLEAFLDAAP